MTLRPLFSALLLLTLVHGRTSAGEDYFLLMFGAQRVPSNPNYSHSFATFVKLTWEGDGPCPTDPTLETRTISWLAANGIVRTHALLPECGHNFELHETLHWCRSNDMRISLWGPYRICPELYALAARQVEVLESGRVRYKANDVGYPSDRVSNCIHALSSIVEGARLRVASPGWGETASFAILQRFERYVVDASGDHAWVGLALGLEQYPIIYRDWQSPRSGLFGPLYRLLGGERDLRSSYGPPAP